MKNNIGKRVFTLILLTVLLGGVSCKKMFDVKPETQVDLSNAYLTLADADAAVLGIYGKFIGLSKQYIILNEVRADLIEVTPNSDPYLIEISEHNVSSKNPYASPRPFYELILNCNDALKNFSAMVKDSRMSVEDFNRRYSDIGALRSWLYLQLGIHYGNVPYITQPFESIDDLNSLSGYQKLPFETLLDSLITFTTNLPYTKSEVFSYPAGVNNTLNPSNGFDFNSFERFYITRPVLLGELNLWRGKYFDAATHYKYAMEQDQSVGSNNYIQTFRLSTTISNEFHTGVQYGVISSNPVEFPQNEASLVTSTTQGWRSIFGEDNRSRSWQREWYWSLPFSFDFKTQSTNPFTNVFDNIRGKYLLKPSQAIVDNWNSQVTRAGLNFDPRGRLSTMNSNGQLVITKFTDILSTSVTNGQWNIWRAGGVHLHYAEAANREGHGKLGWALLNIGIADTYSPPPRTADLAQLNAMQTPFPTTSPFYFDARDEPSGGSIRNRAWTRNAGVRGRAKIMPHSAASQTDLLLLEDQLINEGALELAFEGQRWGDLLRVSLRRNDPSYLAEKIYQKFAKAGDPAKGAQVKARILANYYLPFDIYTN